MIKKIVSLFVIIVMLISLVSCSVIEPLLPDGMLDGIFGGENDRDDTGTPDVDSGDDEGNSGGLGSDDVVPGPGGEDAKPDDGKEDPDTGKDDNTDDGTDDPIHDPTCEDGCSDKDGDAACDNCGADMIVPPELMVPVIYLAGDSTVKSYEDNQFIGGWGQFLEYFLDGVTVVNAAQGGRSARSFINEGRLYDIEGSSYTFSQNGGNSIADVIQEGDYLFIQFGHNDDDTKAASNYGTMYDRMTPLGTPDANGIYPTTPAERVATTYLPEVYTSKATDSEETAALKEIAKYGDEYYAYGSGTYKWYLKQYIDFARSVGAIPVLVTPVARVKFNSNGEIIGGAGLHGENFAYVQAVRQLAEEEGCLLIDLFADSKTILETAGPTYANYLMALKPNDLVGSWPGGYDSSYGNTEAGYTGIEATHYNKYGAFLQAAAVAQHLAAFGDEISFGYLVNSAPEKYTDPSNLIGKNTVAKIEALFDTVNVTNPNRWYPSPDEVISKINEIKLTYGEITQENYVEVGELCEYLRSIYIALNVDDRPLVTNLSDLESAEARVKEFEIANRPKPTKVVFFDADNLSQSSYTSTVVEGDFTLVATSDKAMDKKSKSATFTHNGEVYEFNYGLSVGGSAKFGSSRYVSFTVEGPCSITIAVQSTGSSVRTLNMVNSSGTSVGSYEAGTALTVSTIEIDAAGTYSVGSAGSGIYIFAIIIEYFE